MSIANKLLMKLNPKAVIERSSFFDSNWYKGKYGISSDCAKHYLNEGWKMDYDPSDRFSSKDYLINNPDISGINPLLHYEVFGKYEGRRPFVPRTDMINDPSLEEIEIPYDVYYEKIKEKDVVSFDVFDTLVIRPFVKAEELFDYMEIEYSCEGYSSARKKAERDARAILKKEVSIDEIYECIDEKYRFLKEKEIECEIRFCHLNPLIRPVFDKARELNKRVIAVSDMYLPGSVVEKILEESDYHMDEIYVSCDFNKTKGLGDLYQYVLEKEGIKAGQMIHFGDNYISDYSEAVNNGLTAFQTPKIIDQVFSQEDHRSFLPFMNAHLSLSSSMYLTQVSEYLGKEKDIPFFEKLGYLFGGPLALGYLHFICEEAGKDEIDRFFFVSRDGYALKQLYEKYFCDKYQINSAYAYLSRACIYSGSVENQLTTDQDLIHSLAMFHLSEMSSKQEIDAWSIDQSDNLRNHLIQISEGSERIATVDMFSGNYTSQKGAEFYLKDRIVKGYYAGNFADSQLSHKAFSKRLLGMRDNLPVKMSEFLITSYESPIIGVDRNGKPIYEYAQNENKRVRYDQIMKGISDFIDDHRSFFPENDRYILSLEEWIDLMDSYLRNCSEKDIEELLGIVDSENPVSGKDDKNIAELIRSYRDRGY